MNANRCAERKIRAMIRAYGAGGVLRLSSDEQSVEVSRALARGKNSFWQESGWSSAVSESLVTSPVIPLLFVGKVHALHWGCGASSCEVMGTNRRLLACLSMDWA